MRYRSCPFFGIALPHFAPMALFALDPHPRTTPTSAAGDPNAMRNPIRRNKNIDKTQAGRVKDGSASP